MWHGRRDASLLLRGRVLGCVPSLREPADFRFVLTEERFGLVVAKAPELIQGEESVLLAISGPVQSADGPKIPGPANLHGRVAHTGDHQTLRLRECPAGTCLRCHRGSLVRVLFRSQPFTSSASCSRDVMESHPSLMPARNRTRAPKALSLSWCAPPRLAPRRRSLGAR